MGKRLVLHIGGSKCGSSAIQNYLAKNHTQMMQNGVFSPDQELDTKGPYKSQQIFYFQNLKTQDNAQGILEQKFRQICRFMDRHEQQTLIVSAENLSLIPTLPEILKRAAGDLFESIQVIFYIRRQDDYLISAWQQWGLKTYPDIGTYIEQVGLMMSDWNELLGAWERAFGQSRLIVRPFRRDLLKDGDVVADFLDVLKLPHDGCQPLGGLANRSFDESLADMAHRVSDVFDGPHDNRFYEVMIRTIGEASFKSKVGSHLMTLTERQDILAGFHEGNEAIKHRYLPELGDMPLFNPPTERDVASPNDHERLAAENALLSRAVFQLAQRIEALEKDQLTDSKNRQDPTKGNWLANLFNPR